MNDEPDRVFHRSFDTVIGMTAVFLAACVSGAPIGDFRTSDRPEHHRQVSVAEVDGILQRGGTVIDVRLREDYDADPVLIPGAQYRDPELMTEWAGEIDASASPVVVYCVRGKWVSQKVAHYLASQGLQVYSLQGGLEAWQADGDPPTRE